MVMQLQSSVRNTPNKLLQQTTVTARWDNIAEWRITWDVPSQENPKLPVVLC